MARCVFLVRGRPCGRQGSGNPPLCDAHLADLAEGDDLDEVDGEDDAVANQILSHPAVQGVLARVTALIDRAGVALERGINNVGRSEPRQPNRPQPPRPRRPTDPQAQARLVLGFGPAVTLSPQMIKERRRKLAAIIHSDRETGSEEAMKLLNQAADVLLAPFKRRPPSP